ncbi:MULTISPECIES: TonB-dependent receptor domain-containing protein [Capnocytophaga]|uniref:TonB-dependent receptor n=1 Tax=Capnocytophaga TaxID=1016 RepID=UPI00020C8B81|nr:MULTISPECIES: TonB-dependent receptor [unclassified Capnocytophaga]KHE70205.1 TonB-dependent receptor [Capnocytophaga sp. oral taxon 329 str. F0087]QGS17698.1 TonB-dependent receptor plug domain-containing protein [Capnocytophaga sp. FDAARGOS_737]
MLRYILLWGLLLPLTAFAQQFSKGTVVDEANLPLMGAEVYWNGTQIGVSTDDNGTFTLKRTENSNTLVISYIGYKTKTVKVTNSEVLHIQLEPQSALEEVVVTQKRANTMKSQWQVANLHTMSSGELLKAACCNLSESFSTNPSIDVNFSDAVTGNKQIKMLGLTSPYILMAEENIPAMRGASQAYGLSFVPGTWIESIQITKGAGSVINGYESISGQINYEIEKPINARPFFLNLYTSEDSRYELNAHTKVKLSDKWATSLLAHGNVRQRKSDHNHDGFIDNPIGNQINLLNRWQYSNAEKGWVSFLNLNYMKDERQAGQIDYNPLTDKGTTNAWGSEVNSERFTLSNKTGYVFPDTPYKSIGLQNSFQSHRQDSYFGLNSYDIHQKSWYGNLIYNSIIGNTQHKFATGLSGTYDDYNELLTTSALAGDFSRIDRSVGAFFEYTYDNSSNFSFVAGIRADSHNNLGNFITPRFHLRYNPWKEATFRLSAGRGKRAANVIAENQQLLASSRQLHIIGGDGGKLYGLNPEIAWNYGASFLQAFKIWGKNAELSVDFYRTHFDNQVVVDLDHSPQQALFYNLDGKSFANSLQAEVSITPAKGLDFKAAYKYYDVQTQFTKGQLEKTLTPKHRWFANVAYETADTHDNKHSQWKFDVTFNWLGEQRLPSTATNPLPYRLSDYAPSFATLNAQITRVFSKTFEVYVGGENITNYKQANGILAADAPFGAYFDSTMQYAPAFGQMYYAGLRFKL